ncbi:cytochrome P450 [Artomyces pyxidatus]|uniref:Cytochrome P450 n=1 Tax=Artomyces pyxidatus TaxID=48021 RepID=A0ACB8T0V1_9AGAM|nr:cytochrome P450 [Artomyces pyxidatus]
MSVFTALGLLSCTVALWAVTTSIVKRLSRQLPLPPGPKPLPIIGNLLDVPTKAPWATYAKWAEQYGDVMSMTVLGKVMVILNSSTAVRDLLDKRGSIYSDRPVVPFTELSGVAHWDLSIIRYGEGWRIRRRLMEHSFRPASIVQYRQMQKSKVHETLRRLLRNPLDFDSHIKQLSSIVMSIVYGYDVKDHNDRFIQIADASNRIGAEANTPGAFLVNDLPFLRYLPGWLPGMRFKAVAQQSKNIAREMIENPFDFVKENMRNGTSRQCFVRENLNKSEKSDETAIAHVAAAIYGAGVHTTGSTIRTFLLAMALNPDVQQKAQAELDEVLGSAALPDFSDRPRLPYIEAICKEVIRWRTIVPLASYTTGVPHATMESDVYGGHLIPKGSVIFANAWSILHDPAVYPNPDTFNPGRFLEAGGRVLDDSTLSSMFGFGRRICPGRHLADASIWIFVVSFLSVFNVSDARDVHGNKARHDHPYADFLVSDAAPFTCYISVRDERSEGLIVSSAIAEVD